MLDSVEARLLYSCVIAAQPRKHDRRLAFNFKEVTEIQKTYGNEFPCIFRSLCDLNSGCSCCTRRNTNLHKAKECKSYVRITCKFMLTVFSFVCLSRCMFECISDVLIFLQVLFHQLWYVHTWCMHQHLPVCRRHLCQQVFTTFFFGFIAI